MVLLCSDRVTMVEALLVYELQRYRFFGVPQNHDRCRSSVRCHCQIFGSRVRHSLESRHSGLGLPTSFLRLAMNFVFVVPLGT